MTEFKPVALVSPDGRDYTATTPAELNDLVYGHGYKEKGAKAPAAKKDEGK